MSPSGNFTGVPCDHSTRDVLERNCKGFDMLLTDRISKHRLVHFEGKICFHRFPSDQAEALLRWTFGVSSADAPTNVAAMPRQRSNPWSRSLVSFVGTPNALRRLQRKTEGMQTRIQQGVLGFLLKINLVCEFLNFLRPLKNTRKQPKSSGRVMVEIRTIWGRSTHLMRF